MLRSLWVIGLLGLISGITQIQAAETRVLPPYSQGYDPARDPFSDGRAALQLAGETGRRVLIEVGGNWCSWCHVLERFLDQHPSVRTKLHETFVLLKVNVDDENDNSEFLSAFPKAMGYPHMYITENDGSIVHSQDTAEFLHDGKYSEPQFLAFLARWSLRHE
ncbi:MAG: thioredoxin family protein [Gammaproteobacteria bacterium]